MFPALMIASLATIWLTVCVALIGLNAPVGLAFFFFSGTFIGCWAVS